uniref:cation-transporting P-type ATPase n=1 Tax=Nitratifractor sp. TaxID=2268144 RepID=UPI0025D99714
MGRKKHYPKSHKLHDPAQEEATQEAPAQQQPSVNDTADTAQEQKKAAEQEADAAKREAPKAQESAQSDAAQKEEQAMAEQEEKEAPVTTDLGAKGLTSEEAQELLKKYGYNEIKAKEETWLHRLFRRFWGPIPWMIEIAAILSAIAHRWEDFTIIMVL